MSAEIDRLEKMGVLLAEVEMWKAATKREARRADEALRMHEEHTRRANSERASLVCVVNEAMELLGLPPGSTDEQFLDAIRELRTGFADLLACFEGALEWMEKRGAPRSAVRNGRAVLAMNRERLARLRNAGS